MKKIFLLFLLLVAGLNANAQKSYINVYVTGLGNSNLYQYCWLSGDVPEGINVYDSYRIGDLLNRLTQDGYEVEFVVNAGTASVNFLLSKKSSADPDNPDIVTYQRDITDDTEAYEVARYNLQGLPVNKDEKGVQIVVYSNYTTKTIIKE